MYKYFHQCRGCKYDRRVTCKKLTLGEFIDYEVGKDKCDTKVEE